MLQIAGMISNDLWYMVQFNLIHKMLFQPVLKLEKEKKVQGECVCVCDWSRIKRQKKDEFEIRWKVLAYPLNDRWDESRQVEVKRGD